MSMQALEQREVRDKSKSEREATASSLGTVQMTPDEQTREVDAPVQFLPGTTGYGYAVQTKGGAKDAETVKSAAQEGLKGSGGELPHLDRIQQSFGGHDVSTVQAHVGGSAAEANRAMGARAYASGNQVAFREQPDLHTAAHEAAHVVQQRAGVSLADGVGRTGDAYERNADAVADRVVRGRSAEDLLSTQTMSSPQQGVQGKGLVVQKADPPPGLAEEAKSKGVVLKEFTLLNGGKGWCIDSALSDPKASMADDKSMEAMAEACETAFGAAAMNNSGAHTASSAMCDGVKTILTKYTAAFNEHLTKLQAEGKALDVKAQTLNGVVSKMLGVASPDMGVAGAVGTDAATLLSIIDAKKEGNIREQMTIVFNFGGSFGNAMVDQKVKGLVDGFAAQLTGFEVLKNRIEKMDKGASTLEAKKAELQAKLDAGTELTADEKKIMEKKIDNRLVHESQTGDVGGQGSTRGVDPNSPKKGTNGAQVDFQSQRGVSTAGLQLTSRELWFMYKAELEALGATPDDTAESMIAKLGESKLKWSEGMEKWAANEADGWVQVCRDLGLPVKAGPSGTTDRIMTTATMTGYNDPVGARAASLAYLLPINAHSMAEIMMAAAPYCGEDQVLSLAMYREVAPFGPLNQFYANPLFWAMVNKDKAEIEKILGIQ